MAATWHSKSTAPRWKLTRSPGRRPCAGRTREPLTCTLPPLTASAASDRDLKRRTAKSQRSMRARGAGCSLLMGAVLAPAGLMAGGSSGDTPPGLDDRAAGIETAPVAELLELPDVPDDEVRGLTGLQSAPLALHAERPRRVPRHAG